MKLSRKTIGFIIAIVGSVLALVQEQFKLNLDPIAIAAGVGAILTYIFFESKLDLKLLQQPGRWKDWKFLFTSLSVILAATEATFQLGIPVEGIISGLTTLVAILFGVKIKADVPY